MKKLCSCHLTKVQLLDKILKKVGYKKGKSKYSDGQITKEEMLYIYAYVRDRKEKDMESIEMIANDEREIERIEIFTQNSMDIVGYTKRDGYTKIVPYHENGEMSPVVWFAILKDNMIVSRVNSKYVQCIDYV